MTSSSKMTGHKVMPSTRVSVPGGGGKDHLPQMTSPNWTQTSDGVGPQENRDNVNRLKDSSTPAAPRDAKVP
jgi:hypothetical protein